MKYRVISYGLVAQTFFDKKTLCKRSAMYEGDELVTVHCEDVINGVARECTVCGDAAMMREILKPPPPVEAAPDSENSFSTAIKDLPKLLVACREALRILGPEIRNVPSDKASVVRLSRERATQVYETLDEILR